jgi:hypothetical protein
MQQIRATAAASSSRPDVRSTVARDAGSAKPPGPTGAGQNQPSSGHAAHFGRHERWGWLVKQHGKVGQALANADSEAA